MVDKSASHKAKVRAEREVRLKQALRANLKRRKQAAKAAKPEQRSAPAADGAEPAGAFNPPADRESQP